jgi:hypothetical protein
MLKSIKLAVSFLHWQIYNLNNYRSFYKSIFLSTIVQQPVVERHGMNEILKPLVNELNQLYDSGIIIRRSVERELLKVR